MKKLLLLSLLFILTSCSKGFVLELKKDDLAFTAHVIEYGEGLENDQYRVSGSLEIKNIGFNIINYSNSELFVVIETEAESRAYRDSIASHVIDFSDAEIGVGETLKQKVYWVFPQVKSLKAEKVYLEWRPK